MSHHLTRDLLTLSNASCPGTNMYALSIFLIGCGGFKLQGQTNFPVMSGSHEVTHGISASINAAHAVSLPTGSHLVSASDINRLLVLRSKDHSRSNSGIFRVTGFDPTQNSLTIDYRSSVAAPVERDMSWYLFIDEHTAAQSWQTGPNGTTGYNSFNAATFASSSASRVVLTSPDDSSWQVRMCLESLPDISGAVPSAFSIAPGYGGNDQGDFLRLKSDVGRGHDQLLHLHTSLFHNSTSSKYQGMTVGASPCATASGSLWVNGQWRISMILDDVRGSCALINHNVSLPTPRSGSSWCVFGLPDDETEPPGQNNVGDPSVGMRRLFVVGSSNPQSNLTWTSQFHSQNNTQVVGFSRRGYPIPGVLSLYSDISNPGNTHWRYLTSSTNTPWNNSFELLDAEILLGTIDQTTSPSSTQTIFPLQPRRLGKLPFFLQGGSLFGNWALTSPHSDGMTYYHTQDGVFMEWGGPVPTDALVGSNFTITSGTIGSEQGLVHHDAFHPGSDPDSPITGPWIHDIDSNRFRKTYSFYRQVPVIVGYSKGGSNPAKP